MLFNPVDTIRGILEHVGKAYGLEKEISMVSAEITDLIDTMLSNEVNLAFQSGYAAGKIITTLHENPEGGCDDFLSL